jgi:GTP cyclohydrolase I
MAKPRNARRKPDVKAMQKAVFDFLVAAGLDTEDANLKQTPERVTEAWVNEFLDGYALTSAAALGETFPLDVESNGEMVVVTDLRFHSTCPHHLLPYTGTAHIAYVPGKRVVGFGRLSSLLDAFAHRLILQEELAQKVAQTLARVLESPATACILSAEQACLRLRGSRQYDAVTHAEAYEGRLRSDSLLRNELWARIGARK